MTFHPVMLDVPDQIETERLIFRAVKPGDGAVHYSAFRESVADLRRFLAHLPWVKVEPSLANSEKYCRGVHISFLQREHLAYFVYLKSDQSFVGGIGLLRIEWDVPRFEIGYWCRSGVHGKGYTTEAVDGITEFAFTQLAAKRVEIRADDMNIGSWKVAEKAGFPLEGILRNWDRDAVSNELRDLRIYAKTA
jgi:RimJ/RimL family protein N-acetyltransferase